MANSEPTTISHQGASGGKASAMSQAVTMALPSLRKGPSGLSRSFSITASASRQAAVAMAICSRMIGPINQT